MRISKKKICLNKFHWCERRMVLSHQWNLIEHIFFLKEKEKENEKRKNLLSHYIDNKQTCR